MLTKQERAAIAERAASFNEDYLCYADIYECLFGERPRDSALSKEYDKAIKSRLIDLCDTSNMIELPLDKNGEVIRIHDVVYDDTGMEREVSEFRFPFYGACIYARTDDDRSTFRTDELAHKKQVTIKSLVEELRSTLCAAYISGRECEKILHIADQLESLGDGDD